MFTKASPTPIDRAAQVAAPAPEPTSMRLRNAALLAGPILTTAGLAATPWESEKTTVAYHASLAAAPEQAQVAALLLAFGYSLMGLAAIVVLRNADRRFRKHLAVAAVLSWLGATMMPGLLVTDWYDLALAQHLPADQAALVSDATQEYAFGAFLMLPAVAGFVLGPIAVTALAVRSRIVGLWAPILLAAGIPLAMASIAPLVMVASGFTLVVAYAGVARGLARRDGAASPSAAPSDPALDVVLDANRGGDGAGAAH